MKDKVWEFDYEGHLIKITNKISIIPPKTSELLEIDGAVVKHEKGNIFRMNSTIRSIYRFNNIEKNIEVRIAQKTGSLATGAQVYINDEFIGGDKSIQYPDPDEALKQYKKGYFCYFMTVGLLNFGLPYAILMAIFNKADPVMTMVWKFVFHATFFGAIMSYLMWRNIKNRVKLNESI